MPSHVPEARFIGEEDGGQEAAAECDVFQAGHTSTLVNLAADRQCPKDTQ